MEAKVDLTDVTFVIPLRIDSLERLENIVGVCGYLHTYLKTNIMICEADTTDSGLLRKMLGETAVTYFVTDRKSSFHRTYYINELVRHATTPLVAVWDADVVVGIDQLCSAVESLRSGAYEFVYPYDGRFLDTDVSHRRRFLEQLDCTTLRLHADSMRLPYTDKACGGGFLANREAYFKVGLENERFTSWGPEDGERLKRWRTLGMRIGWVRGELFHLYHPRGKNSQFRSEKEKVKLLAEADRTGAMSKEVLEKEVAIWIKKINARKRLLG